MITSTIKLSSQVQNVTFFSTFFWAADTAPGLAPESGIVFYMLCAKYLDTPAALRPPLMIFVELTSHEHPMHTDKLGPRWTAKSRI